MKIDQLRREYLQNGLSRKQLLDDPMEQFNHWLQQAIDAELSDPTAMVLATVDAQGQPSQRIVLLKDVRPEGFVFYTNYESHKAQDISQNNQVSVHFPWHVLERQVKIAGVAEKLPLYDSIAYFISRPKESQLAAWASAQSRPISSRQLLLQQFARIKEKFAQGEVPLPDSWGGYLIRPSHFEFWQGGEHRLHDRFEYRQQEGSSWNIQRLAP